MISIIAIIKKLDKFYEIINDESQSNHLYKYYYALTEMGTDYVRWKNEKQTIQEISNLETVSKDVEEKLIKQFELTMKSNSKTRRFNR